MTFQVLINLRISYFDRMTKTKALLLCPLQGVQEMLGIVVCLGSNRNTLPIRHGLNFRLTQLRACIVKLGDRTFQFHVKHHFPKKLTPEFVLVDLVNNLHTIAEDTAEVLPKAVAKARTMNSKNETCSTHVWYEEN